MKYFIDGNEICLVRDDFINLQESPAVFISLDQLPWLKRLLEDE